MAKKRKSSALGLVTGPIQIAVGLCYIAEGAVVGLCSLAESVIVWSQTKTNQPTVGQIENSPPEVTRRPTRRERVMIGLGSWTAEDERLSGLRDPLEESKSIPPSTKRSWLAWW